jgi:ComF family protein
MLTKIFNLLLPPTCILCGDPARQEIDLCKACQQELPWLTQMCERCALPLTNATTCGACLYQPPPFDKTLALWHYQQPVDHFITNLKFNHQLVYARLLGELLAQRLQQHYQQHALPECIIPVPLHTKRLRERGFNQALEIARPIAKQLKIKLDFKNCQRTRATEAQSALPAKHRHKNVKDAFAIKNKFHARHVALIDDVITTGHTITELSHALRKHDVEQIDVWCCARTSVIENN